MITNKKREELRARLYLSVNNLYNTRHYDTYEDINDEVRRSIISHVEMERTNTVNMLYSFVDGLLDAIYTQEEMKKDLTLR
jgi:hypothetical protein